MTGAKYGSQGEETIPRRKRRQRDDIAPLITYPSTTTSPPWPFNCLLRRDRLRWADGYGDTRIRQFGHMFIGVSLLLSIGDYTVRPFVGAQ